MYFNKKTILVLFVAFFVTSSFANTRSVHATTFNVPTITYPTIQSAINAASAGGDTIIVAAGVYNEQILIDKGVTITGAGAATTTITGAGLIAGKPVVTIDSMRSVSFSGFTITGAPPGGGGDSFGVYAKQSNLTAGITYTVSDCKFFGTNTPGNNGEFQFYESGGLEDVVFTRNVVTQYSGNAFVSEKHTGATEISYCSFDAPLCNVAPADVIFFMTYGGTNVNTLQKFAYNTFNMGTANLKSTAISISAPGAGTGNAVYSNILITGNTFNTLLANGRAIGFWATGGNNIQNPMVTQNLIVGTGAAGSYGINFYDNSGGTTSGAVISCNAIKNMNYGIYLRIGDAPGTTINNNDLTGNTVGVDWTIGLAAVNAMNNWWGSASGPGGIGPGTGDPVTANVVYTPWLTGMSPCAPDFVPPPVGGEWVPINAVQMLIQIIGSAAAIAALAASFVSFKRIKKKQN